MSVSYDKFTEAFLFKIREYDILEFEIEDRNTVVDGFMKRAIAQFKHICQYDLVTTSNDTTREFGVNIEEDDIDEIVDIVSDGMIAQWLKPYVFRQRALTNVLNTKDFTTYSPAELLNRMTGLYEKTQRDYINAVREYSYNHGDLSDLHI